MLKNNNNKPKKKTKTLKNEAKKKTKTLKNEAKEKTKTLKNAAKEKTKTLKNAANEKSSKSLKKKHDNLKPLPQFLNFAPPSLDGDELKELEDTLKSGWITHGPKTASFETEIAAYLKASSSLALSSCTAAMHLALRALEIEAGDGVITSPLTFVSTVHSIVYTSATPFFCDIDPKTGNLDPEKVLHFIENECQVGKDGVLVHKESKLRIKAILIVHYGGFPAKMKAFWDIANRFALHILEDAAHALGTSYFGNLIGSDKHQSNLSEGLHQLSAFSFYATKNLTTGEGGLLTGPSELLNKARILSAYGITDARRIWGRYAPKGTYLYDVESLGFKNNFTDIQAALGLSQLRRFEKFQLIRKKYAHIYTEVFKPLKDLVSIPKKEPQTIPAWHLYPLRLNTLNLDVSRDEFIEILRSYNIGTSVMFIPVHKFTYYQTRLLYTRGPFPEAEKFSDCEISLPMSPKNPEDLVHKAANLICDLILLHAK